MKLVWDHWHIEPSSICSLRCPRCPRAEVPESLLNSQLSLSFFQQQIGPAVIAKIRKITFCGNDGDPIYCKDFLEICRWIKEVNPDLHLSIVTNGSYRPVEWWQTLGTILDAHDAIDWSLDGWNQQSNNLYRVNSNWESILKGYGSFTSANTSTYRVWAAIAFRFNQYRLDHMEQMALDLGFDCFQITKSTKFGSHYPGVYGEDDELCPTRPELISSSHRFEREMKILTDKTRPGNDFRSVFWARAQDLIADNKYSALCLIGNKGVFLNSQGEFYPCCWTANRYHHNQQWLDLAQERFNLRKRPFESILADDYWQTDFLKFDSLECQTKCTPEKLTDHSHVTAW